MKQQTLTGFEKYGKTTRRAQFLADMEQIIPWPELAAAVQAVYPKISENGGRPPIPVERMLRIYFLQLWFNLSDPAVEEALYDSVAMRDFVGIDLGVEGAPDETTVCKFRHLLERNKLGKVLLKAVNDHLHRSGIKITKGTIVDATIMAAPPSTKNKSKARDPEMHQTKKGNQWHFGMKAHIGVDVASGWCTRSPAPLPTTPTSTRWRRCCTAGRRRCSLMPAIPGPISGRNTRTAMSPGTSL